MNLIKYLLATNRAQKHIINLINLAETKCFNFAPSYMPINLPRRSSPHKTQSVEMLMCGIKRAHIWKKNTQAIEAANVPDIAALAIVYTGRLTTAEVAGINKTLGPI